MLKDRSQFFRDADGVGHIVIMYTSGPETLCKIHVTKDRIFEADPDFNSLIVTCCICAADLDCK
jgi:hypothetical protein